MTPAQRKTLYAIVDEAAANGGAPPTIGAIAARLRCSYTYAQDLVAGLRRRGLYRSEDRPEISSAAFQFIVFQNEEAPKTGQGREGF